MKKANEEVALRNRHADTSLPCSQRSIDDSRQNYTPNKAVVESRETEPPVDTDGIQPQQNDGKTMWCLRDVWG